MKVFTIPRGCPVCGGAVSGNSEVKYLCSPCNFYFVRPRKTSFVRNSQLKKFHQFVRSKEGDSYHIANCKYARRIETPIFIDAAEVKNLRACKCVTRA